MDKLTAPLVLEKYAQGERDFRHLNLRGQSFKGQNLAGADFSGCDIRSANFSRTNLTGAKFVGAKAGLQKRWAIALTLISLLLLGLSGLFSFFNSVMINLPFSQDFEASNIEKIIFIAVFLIFYITFLTIATRYGLLVGLGAGLLVLTGVFAVAFAVAFARAGAGAFAVAVALAVAIAGAFAVAVAVAFAVAIAGAFAVGGAFAGAVAFAFAVAGAVAFAFAVAGAVAFAFAVAGAVAFAFVLFSSYFAWRSLKGDSRDPWIRNVAIVFAAIGGTNFYQANLTDADFTKATLKSTSFRKAILIRTCWQETKKLDFARLGNSILAQAQIRELLVTGNGENKSYQEANLRGANLTGANLHHANLKLADLSQSTLANANLEWTNLTEVNAIDANFRVASMTGACLEGWNIESSTNLDRVDCGFVYLLEYPKPGTDDRERRPSSGEFAPGEFTKLFQEVLNTVDLIFRDGVDWQAFIQAFDQVRVESESAELAIQSIENKGDGVFVIRVNVSEDANKETIHRELMENYERELKILEARYGEKLKAKANEIAQYHKENANLWELVKLGASRPINVEATAMANKESGNIEVHGNVGNLGNEGRIDNSVIVTQHNYGEGQNLTEAAREIKQLLEQLSQTYPTNTLVEQAVVGEKAIEEIENNPSLKQRTIAALKASSIEAFVQLIHHPVINVMRSSFEAWQKGE